MPFSIRPFRRFPVHWAWRGRVAKMPPPCSPDRMRENYSSAACTLHCQVIVKWLRYRIVSRYIVLYRETTKQGLTQRRGIVKHGTPRLLPSMYRDAVRN